MTEIVDQGERGWTQWDRSGCGGKRDDERARARRGNREPTLLRHARSDGRCQQASAPKVNGDSVALNRQRRVVAARPHNPAHAQLRLRQPTWDSPIPGGRSRAGARGAMPAQQRRRPGRLATPRPGRQPRTERRGGGRARRLDPRPWPRSRSAPARQGVPRSALAAGQQSGWLGRAGSATSVSVPTAIVPAMMCVGTVRVVEHIASKRR